MSSYICENCDKIFEKLGYLKQHKSKNVCSLVCDLCNYSCKSKPSYYRHRKICKQKQQEQENSDAMVENNTMVDNKNVNVNNGDNNTQNNNNNNVVLMNPFRLDHEYMNRPKMLNPVRGELLQMLRAENYPKAYQILFEQIHGNEKHPEYHNIFLPHRDKDEICVFKGKRFKMENVDDEVPDLYRFLRIEMDWVVKTTDLDPKEKEQLRWDIHANWMATDEKKDQNMRRILRNNKAVVLKTMNDYVVKPNNELVIDFLGIDPSEVNNDYLVTLP